MRITLAGPTTVRGVIDAHRSLCKQASGLLDQVKNIIGKPPSFFQHYSLLPLYHAIVVMIDRLNTDNVDEEDGLLSLRKEAQLQTVLIARTGAEEGLSAPISFESLRSHSLPLQRIDANMQDVDVIRVSLAVAVQFIADLELREELAFPKSENALFEDDSLDPAKPRGFEGNEQVCRNPEAWADANIIAAEKHGYDNNYKTRDSICRLQASLIGEDFSELEHFPPENSWKY